jgi:FHS family L-fucose permease-like MFS transporter
MCILLLVIIRITRMPAAAQSKSGQGLMDIVRELLTYKNYREGVVAQFFYIGAQVTCWTFIIQYGTHVFMSEGMSEKEAEIMSQNYNIMAMVFFTVSRFVCTFFLKYVPAGRLLSVLAICAIAFTGGAIFFPDRNGVYCLVAISACMSLMFPTIYGIALRGMGDKVKVAGAGLIMAIIGGSILPPIQALIIDWNITIFGVPSVNFSFIVPLICFIIIAVYGHRAYVRKYIWKVIE